MIQLRYSYALRLLPLSLLAAFIPPFSRGIFWNKDWLGAADFAAVSVALVAPLCLLSGSLELIHHHRHSYQDLWPRRIWRRQILYFGFTNSIPYLLAILLVYLTVNAFAIVGHGYFSLLNLWSLISVFLVVLMASYLGVFTGSLTLNYVYAPLLAVLWFAAYNWLGFPYYFFLPGGATQPLIGYSYNLGFKSIQWLFALSIIMLSITGIIFPRMWLAFTAGIGISCFLFTLWFTNSDLSPFAPLTENTEVCTKSGFVKICTAEESAQHLSKIVKAYQASSTWLKEQNISINISKITTFGRIEDTCDKTLVVSQRAQTDHIEEKDINNAYIVKLLDCGKITIAKYQQLQDEIWLTDISQQQH